MKKLILLFILSYLVFSCEEPEPVETKGRIAGRIVKEGTNESIKGVTVSMAGIEQRHITGDDGSYKIEDIPAGDYSVSATKGGYVTDSKTFTIVAGKTTQGDFALIEDIPEVHPTSIILSESKKTESIELKNTRSGDMNFTTELSKSWLSVSPEKGVIPSQNKRIISLSADLSNLSYGHYDESLIINTGEASLSVPIQINYEEPPYIKIIEPQGDQVYKMGEVMPIEWSSNMNGHVNIELIRYSSIIQSIDEGVNNNDGGNFSWQISSLDSANYKIKISSVENSNIDTISDAFTIKPGPTPPVVTTGNPVELSSSSVAMKGVVVDLGMNMTQVDQHGHVYSKSNPEPTISDHKTTLGILKDTSSFLSTINNLEAGVTYSIRAYATNNKGTAYGETVTVTTPADLPIVETAEIVAIEKHSAQSGGNIASDGGNTVTERGLCWSKTSPATIDANVIKDSETGIGSYNINLTGLIQGTKYYVRAYAKNSSGYGYGEEKVFTTKPGKPEVLTQEVSSITAMNAKLNGEILSNGGDAISVYGFCWSQSMNVTIGDNILEVGTDNIQDAFSELLGNLEPNNTYYYKAYAKNSAGYGYGQEMSFTTEDGKPDVSTISASVISATESNLSGSITNDGGSAISAYGFCWSKNPDPTTGNNKVEVGTDNPGGQYSKIINNLGPNTQYYVRAYASNSFGTFYGEDVSFTTEEGKYLSFNSPFQDESIEVGSNHQIRWLTNYSDRRIIIEYWNNEGYTELTNNIQLADGYYQWSVPEGTPIGDQNYIKILDYNTLDVLGKSPYFVIPGDITIVKPYEHFAAKFDSVKIEWLTNLENTLKLELYQGSQFITDIATNVEAQDGGYLWNANMNGISTGSGYRIKIIDEDNTAMEKLSGSFSIVKDSMFVTDSRDNRTYKAVLIGDQMWFAENMNLRGQSTYTITEAKDACPDGWHAPFDEEWKKLEQYLGMTEYDSGQKGWRSTGNVGKKLKSTIGWGTGYNGTDEVRFNAKYGESRWLSSSDYKYNNTYRELGYSTNSILRNNMNYSGYNVRCIKD